MSAPVRDAALATAALLLAIVAGSGFLEHVDPALLGYLGATVVAFAGFTWRASAFWRRRPSAFYARALGTVVVRCLRQPTLLREVLCSASRDLVAQTFVARRSRVRWAAHLLLSLGTLASFAITLPLVFGWMRFVADGPAHYRAVALGVASPRFAVDGALGWLAFHALSLAGGAVLLGAIVFLVRRVRLRALPGELAAFHTAPLVLLLVVAATGLALPATRHAPRLFDAAALAHEIAVIVLLVALPFSKLHHVIVRPLQIGARLVRAPGAALIACADCGVALAPAAQRAAVAELLARRGPVFAAHGDLCPACRRRRVARAQAALIGAAFHPDPLATQPAPRAARRAA